MVRLPDETRERIARYIREYPALSDRALSKAVGVTPTSIGRWRRKLNSPRVPGPPQTRIEWLTLALARQYPSADVDELVATLDQRFHVRRASTMRALAAWLSRYADALDPEGGVGRQRWTPRSEAGPDVNQDRRGVEQ